MQKLWIATELFYPEETSTSFILTKIANRLSEKYAVEVVCGNAVYDLHQKSESFTLDSKVRVHRIKGFSGDKNSLVSRSLRFVLLSWSLFFYLYRNVKKGEKVLMVTNPAPLLILVSLLKRWRKIHLVILVHDVFPENTIPAGILSSKESVIYRIFKRIFDKAYSGADELIVLGRDMKKVLAVKTKKFKRKPVIRIIENWSDAEHIYPIPKEKLLPDDSVLKNRVVFQYAGNIGRVQGLLELLEVIKRVNNELLAFYFVGEGAVKNKMKDFVASNGLSNVFFGDAYSREEQAEVLNKADVAFVSLAPGMFGLGVPSKTYNILAAGKPVLYIGEKNTEIDLLVNEKNIGYSFQNAEDLVHFFNNFNENSVSDLEIKKINARNVAESEFSESVILNKFYESI